MSNKLLAARGYSEIALLNFSHVRLFTAKAKLADLPDDDEFDDELAWRTFDGSSTATVDALEPVDLDESNSTYVSESLKDLYNESIVERPLVDVIIPISELRDEYQNPKFIEQLNWLADHGFQSIRRTRAFGFAFVEHLLHASDIKTAVHRAIKVLDSTLPLLDAAGFDKISYEDSHSIFKDLIQDIASLGADGQHTTVESILAYFQDFYTQIQLAPDDYAPFLTNQDIPNSEDILAPEDFNAKFVIPLGKEAG
ncbi:hypothetical protein H0H93_001691 [Arthromyces matolae]|nr:hypothetical protein H0H93_001691 [Arthromyces matolae]